MVMSDWTSSETISPPNRITINYVGKDSQGNNIEKQVALLGSTRSTSNSEYQSITYRDKDGKPQSTEVIVRKTDITWSTIASVNQSYVSWRLSKQLRLPVGNAMSKNITISEYIVTVDGPFLFRETTENYDSMAQFSGGLQIQDYTTFTPSGTEMILTQRTIREMKALKSADGRNVTKTATSRWMATGVNSEGKTDFAKSYQKLSQFFATKPQLLGGLIQSYTELIFEGTEVQIETGRMPVPEKPSDQDIARDEVVNGSSGSSGSSGDGGTATEYSTDTIEISNDKFITGTVLFDGAAYNDGNPTVTATYDMPFAPDDTFAYINGSRQLMRGGAKAAAEAFGRIESALDIGHAYGQNIVAGWNEIPTLDLSPIYVRLAGIEGAFLLDSCSYAWDADAMVISSDLMLLGVSGWYGTTQPSTSWLRLPVPVSGLQQVSAGSTGTAAKANSIAIPNGFSSSNPGPVLAQLPNNGADTYALFRTEQSVISPTLEMEQTVIATGPLLIAQEFPYALTLPMETTVIATGPSIDESS